MLEISQDTTVDQITSGKYVESRYSNKHVTTIFSRYLKLNLVSCDSGTKVWYRNHRMINVII